MNSISVNGKTYRSKKSISISKGKVIIDGQKVNREVFFDTLNAESQW